MIPFFLAVILGKNTFFFQESSESRSRTTMISLPLVLLLRTTPMHFQVARKIGVAAFLITSTSGCAGSQSERNLRAFPLIRSLQLSKWVLQARFILLAPYMSRSKQLENMCNMGLLVVQVCDISLFEKSITFKEQSIWWSKTQLSALSETTSRWCGQYVRGSVLANLHSSQNCLPLSWESAAPAWSPYIAQCNSNERFKKLLTRHCPRSCFSAEQEPSRGST